MLPKGDARQDRVLLRFARAVQAVAPNATGGPVSLISSRRTVLGAFERAGAYAVAAIAVVLLLALRRPGDVVALPLLLGIGVAFQIYYVMAERRGLTDLLQSTLTRAILFGAMTTGATFVSLWWSPEPGLSSMGELMILALLCTLVAAVLFQPALMGAPCETVGPGDR